MEKQIDTPIRYFLIPTDEYNVLLQRWMSELQDLMVKGQKGRSAGFKKHNVHRISRSWITAE